MNGFVDFLVSNWDVNGCVGIEKKFGHSRKFKTDKKSDVETVEHIVTVGLKWFDKDNRLLFSDGIKFVNNLLSKNEKKKLHRISGDELENKFMVAKNDILDVILDEYLRKILELNDKKYALVGYRNEDKVGTSREFSGEHVEIVGGKTSGKKSGKKIEIIQVGTVGKKVKKEFDM